MTMSEQSAGIKLPADIPEDIAAIAARCDADAASELARIGQEADRARAKAARKALYLLKLRGIEPLSAEDAPESPAVEAARGPVPETCLTYADANGTRFLHICPNGREGPRTMVQFGANGEVLACTSRGPSLAELEQRWKEQGGKTSELAFASPVPADYARYLMEQGERLTLQMNRLVPVGFHGAMAMLPAPARAYDRPLVYELISEDEVTGNALGTRSPEQLLRQFPLPLLWPSADELAPCVQRIQDISSSPLILGPEQRREQVERVLADAADALVTEERRRQLVSRLEMDALVAWQDGKKDLAVLILHHAVEGAKARSGANWPLALFIVRIHIAGAIRNATKSGAGSADALRDTEVAGHAEVPIIRAR